MASMLACNHCNSCAQHSWVYWAPYSLHKVFCCGQTGEVHPTIVQDMLFHHTVAHNGREARTARRGPENHLSSLQI